jgi:hypothetical protein
VRRAAAALLAGLIAVGVASTVLAGDEPRPDVRVAQLSGGRCGKPADSLPILITARGIRPGDVAGDVVACVSSTGDAGRLSLAATELADLDPACSAGEDAVDPSCGGDRPGELSASLVQQVAVDACPAQGIDGALERHLPALAASPLVLRDRLRRNELLCVRLRLLYRASGFAAIGSQSDRTAWRYTFVLTR